MVHILAFWSLGRLAYLTLHTAPAGVISTSRMAFSREGKPLSTMVWPDIIKVHRHQDWGCARIDASRRLVALADMRPDPSETDTTLTYYVAAKVGGSLAQLGSHNVYGFAKKIADQFLNAPNNPYRKPRCGRRVRRRDIHR